MTFDARSGRAVLDRGGGTVAIATPAPRGSRSGNRVTALRWARLLRQLGHRPFLCTDWHGRPADALLAVHARKSASAVRAWVEHHGSGAAVGVLLAGTEVYPRWQPDAAMLECLRSAGCLIALQPEALAVLPAELRPKARVLLQSARAVHGRRPDDALQACVLAHLRAVKDPLLPFAAAALVPRSVPVRVLLAGEALDPAMAATATTAAAAAGVDAAGAPRARWLGPLRRSAALRLLAESHVCVVSSLGEGGANVLSEAIAAGTPPLATAIPGNTGILGDDWPALFAPGSAAELASLLERVATDGQFLTDLRRRTAGLLPLVEPDAERRGLAGILRELGVATPADR